MKVLIVVTHLLGTGHLSRALTLARAYREAGHDVTVASGGMAVPHLGLGDVTMLQLPPLRADGLNFSTLLDADGNPASDALMARRREVLLRQITTHPPDLLITELYPFGRRNLAREFDALLAAARDLPRRPLICASIRDILAPPSKPAKAERTAALVQKFYDAVLVHSVEALTPLSVSWPVTGPVAEKLHYTGFVAPAAASPDPTAPGRNAVVVSAGGGAVGQDIFETAIAAAGLSPQMQWHLLIGGDSAPKLIEEFGRVTPENVHLHAARPDFRQMLLHARVSVSMCGYNTALDVLQSGVPAVFVPFDAGSEVEQTLRATALSRQDGIATVRAADLSSEALLDAIEDVLAAPRRLPARAGMDGAEKTVRITTELVENRR